MLSVPKVPKVPKAPKASTTSKPLKSLKPQVKQTEKDEPSYNNFFIKPDSDVSQTVSVLKDISSNTKINNEMKKTAFWLKNTKSFFTLLTSSGAQRRPPVRFFVSSMNDPDENGDVYLAFDPVGTLNRKTGHAEAIWVKPDKTLDVSTHFTKIDDFLLFLPFVVRFANALDCTFIGFHVHKPNLDTETINILVRKYFFAPTNLVRNESGDVLKARKLFLSKPTPLGSSPQFTWSSAVLSTNSTNNNSNSPSSDANNKRTHRSPSRPKRTRSIKRSPARQA